ncbi:MAG: hypothetical protein ACYDH6_13255 [Acidimicrobiales bacterium]
MAAAALLVASALPIAARAATVPPAQDIQNLPAQYIAKLFTEGLGRAPDQTAWNDLTAQFDVQGCSVSSLQRVGKIVLESPELLAQWGHDPYALTTIAFRAVLNREADADGFNALIGYLGSHDWDATLDLVFGSNEFGGLSAQICSATASSYGFNGSTGIVPPGIAGPIAACTTCIPVSTPNGTTNPSEAQLRLMASMPGETIVLAPRSVIPITQPLTLAPGVTLETAGLPGPTQYLNMARLVRAWGTNPRGVENATVVLQGSSTLRSVWVSGQRALWRNAVSQSVDGKEPTFPNTYGQVLYGEDVRTLGGFSTSVLDSRLDDSPGWSTIEVLGADAGHGCVDNTVAGNLIEAYSSVHIAAMGKDQVTPWTDGISVHCQASLVTMNQIVDASDVPLIVFEFGFNPNAAVPAQRSQLSSNVIVSAGNSAYTALAADPGYKPSGGDPDFSDGSQDFTGTIVGGTGRVPGGSDPTIPGQGNLLWSGSRTHFNAVISDGTTDFFGPNVALVGKGAKFLNNTTGIQRAYAAAGIVVSGMMDTTVDGNSLNITLIPGSPTSIWRCSGAEHEVEWYYPQRASGSVQGHPVATQIPPASPLGCIVSGT